MLRIIGQVARIENFDEMAQGDELRLPSRENGETIALTGGMSSATEIGSSRHSCESHKISGTFVNARAAAGDLECAVNSRTPHLVATSQMLVKLKGTDRRQEKGTSFAL